MSEKDLIDFTPELKAEALKIVSEYKYGPLYTPPVLLGSPEGPKGTLLMPGTNGGADWGGAAFDKETGILYVPSAHLPTVIALGKSQHPESTLPYVKQTVPRLVGPQGLPDPFKPPYSRLVAIDLNKGDILWSVANGDGLRNHPAFKGLNLPPHRHARDGCAALVTKTFVFMGEGSDSGVGRAAGRRRQDVPRVRQEDRQDRVGDGAARRRQQRADDLHGQRQAVHRRRRFGPAVSGRARRALVARLAVERRLKPPPTSLVLLPAQSCTSPLTRSTDLSKHAVCSSSRQQGFSGPYQQFARPSDDRTVVGPPGSYVGNVEEELPMIRQAAATIVALCLSASPLHAQSAPSAAKKVTVSEATAVHKTPSVASPVVGNAPRGTELVVTREVGDWVKVAWPSAADGVGYVRVNALARGNAAAPAVAKAPAAAAPKAATAPATRRRTRKREGGRRPPKAPRNRESRTGSWREDGGRTQWRR